MEGFIDTLSGMSLFQRVIIIALIPAILTTIGAAPALFYRFKTEKYRSIGLGFSAGIMLVASFTSLLIPAIEVSSAFLGILGFVLGLFVVKGLDIVIPHEHFEKGYEGLSISGKELKKLWLLALAMIIHNIPEGMAVGASTVYSIEDGLLLAIAIGLQDMPEGLAVSMPLASMEKGRVKGFLVGALSGFSETLAALIPLIIVTYITTALPLLMALAAGAMVYVVIHEIVPDIMNKEHSEEASIGFFLGFIVMLFLDSIF
ncbi:MAG: ZIP family metal transporter [Candidatus Njordarchaeales archaeon]